MIYTYVVYVIHICSKCYMYYVLLYLYSTGFESEWHKAGLKALNNAAITNRTKHRLVFVR